MQAHFAGAEAYMIWSELIPDAFDGGCHKWSGDDHQQQLCMLDNLSHIRAGSQPIWRLVPLQHQKLSLSCLACMHGTCVTSNEKQDPEHSI